MKKNIFKAFTLAEIMIVLTIIGVITAILLPIAINSSPDENVMKFKKGNNTLGTVIRELVNSDKYYANGDLGIKPDGTLIDGTHEGDYKYFCQTFADIVTAKNINCRDNAVSSMKYSYTAFGCMPSGEYCGENAKTELDEICKELNQTNNAEITTSDGIIYYLTSPRTTFGASQYTMCINSQGDEITDDIINSCYPDYISRNARLFEANEYHADANGFIRIYKPLCMDIDGMEKGEDPFGYGIRVDGKILTGARADEWINKSMQKGD